jgi:pimeloyl-ACP methyl ester carboxylesterase
MQKQAQLNGIEISWIESGQGKPLLMLHGFPFDNSTWQEQQTYFSTNGWRTIAPDLRGFGKSTINADEINTMELLAADVIALMDYLQLEQAVIMGLSMGGYISFSLYRQYPERVKGLILADTKAEGDSSEARENRYKLREQVKIKGSSAATEGMLPKLFSLESYREKPDTVAALGGVIERTSPATIIATLPGLAERQDSTPLLPQIKIPALVIHGKDDQMMPVENARQMAQALPDWQFSSVPHAGHMSNMENPEFFNRAVESFLRELKS